MRVRKYADRKGPYPDVDLSEMSSLGSRQIGRAMVDCGFLPSQSKWGVYDEKRAAILRFRFALREPDGFKLASADVYLSFESDKTGETPAPAVTEHVYPSTLRGPAMTYMKTQNRSYVPEAGVSNIVSFGGLGMTSSKEWESTQRSTFQSHILQTGNTATIHYNNVSWLWQANKYNKQNDLMGPISMGVVINHWDQPFRTNLKIEGRLSQGFRHYIRSERSNGLKYKPTCRRFRSYPGASEDLRDAVRMLETTIEDENRRTGHEIVRDIAQAARAPEAPPIVHLPPLIQHLST